MELPGRDHLMWAGDADAILDEIEAFLTGVRRGPDPNRVLVTLLFTDVVGSTDLAARLGDERWKDVLERHHGLLAAAVERFRGREVDRAGDGILATFDGPARAVRCATEAVRRVREDLGIELRAGVHTGEVELVGPAVRGLAVHLAARIAALAGPGEVLASSTVRDLVVGSGIVFADRGEHELKGVPGRWRLFAAEAGSR